MVANSTSHGTMRSNTLDGVSRSSTAPIAPAIRLMMARARNDSRAVPLTCSRPIQDPATWPGKRATAEVMLAVRASMPVRIRAGRVMNDPPPASWFCAPAHRAATNRMTKCRTET